MIILKWPIKKLKGSLIIISIIVGGLIGMAFKFIYLFEKWVYFPWFPNILDSIFIILGATYLGIKAFKHENP